MVNVSFSTIVWNSEPTIFLYFILSHYISRGGFATFDAHLLIIIIFSTVFFHSANIFLVLNATPRSFAIFNILSGKQNIKGYLAETMNRSTLGFAHTTVTLFVPRGVETSDAKVKPPCDSSRTFWDKPRTNNHSKGRRLRSIQSALKLHIMHDRVVN